ncbi:MAG: hypothetical protein ACRYHQ_09930, partial [Janthinobacterium lividum]
CIAVTTSAPERVPSPALARPTKGAAGQQHALGSAMARKVSHHLFKPLPTPRPPGHGRIPTCDSPYNPA